MATYNDANLKALYGAAGSQFPTNTTGQITSAIMRQFGEDLIDSMGTLLSHPMIRFGGAWAFPAGAFPVAANAGTLYVATADKGALGDPDYVAAGTWFVSLVNGANTYAQYSFKP
jgi:hypothetical protein